MQWFWNLEDVPGYSKVLSSEQQVAVDTSQTPSTGTMMMADMWLVCLTGNPIWS